MILRIDKHVCDAMLAAARKAAPLEACGLLAGSVDHVTRFYELTNADRSAEHFSMIPQDQFAVAKDIRAKGLRLAAVWHSHPVTPARMSAEDLRLAYMPDVIYIVVSLASPLNPDIRGFVVQAGAAEQVAMTVCACAPKGASIEESEP